MPAPTGFQGAAVVRCPRKRGPDGPKSGTGDAGLRRPRRKVGVWEGPGARGLPTGVFTGPGGGKKKAGRGDEMRRPKFGNNASRWGRRATNGDGPWLERSTSARPGGQAPSPAPAADWGFGPRELKQKKPGLLGYAGGTRAGDGGEPGWQIEVRADRLFEDHDACQKLLGQLRKRQIPGRQQKPSSPASLMPSARLGGQRKLAKQNQNWSPAGDQGLRQRPRCRAASAPNRAGPYDPHYNLPAGARMPAPPVGLWPAPGSRMIEGRADQLRAGGDPHHPQGSTAANNADRRQRTQGGPPGGRASGPKTRCGSGPSWRRADRLHHYPGVVRPTRPTGTIMMRSCGRWPQRPSAKGLRGRPPVSFRAAFASQGTARGGDRGWYICALYGRPHGGVLGRPTSSGQSAYRLRRSSPRAKITSQQGKRRHSPPTGARRPKGGQGPCFEQGRRVVVFFRAAPPRTRGQRPRTRAPRHLFADGPAAKATSGGATSFQAPRRREALRGFARQPRPDLSSEKQ